LQLVVQALPLVVRVSQSVVQVLVSAVQALPLVVRVSQLAAQVLPWVFQVLGLAVRVSRLAPQLVSLLQYWLVWLSVLQLVLGPAPQLASPLQC
jgi:hypothetical protein